MFLYYCPHCEQEMEGSFGDNVFCEGCNKSYETDWDYTTPDQPAAWLTGKEYEGKVDINTENNN